MRKNPAVGSGNDAFAIVHFATQEEALRAQFVVIASAFSMVVQIALCLIWNTYCLTSTFFKFWVDIVLLFVRTNRQTPKLPIPHK